MRSSLFSSFILVWLASSSAKVPKTKIVCEDTKVKEEKLLIISGNHVKFSDFLKNSNFSEHPSPSWPWPCNGNNVKQLLVTSIDILEIDKDFDATGLKLTVSLIAPNWRVTKPKAKIILSGRNGKEPDAKAKNGQYQGEAGANGSEGYPGGDGGHLFGIYDGIISPEELEVLSNGGNGGRGQNGGDGKRGSDGENANYADFPSVFRAFLRTFALKVFNRHKHTYSQGILYYGKFSEEEIDFRRVVAGIYNHETYFMIGKNGQDGGNGGNGGDAGTPGKLGTIELIHIRNVPTNQTSGIGVKSKTEAGHSGTFGLGGKGADGGRQGDVLNCLVHSYLFVVFHWGKCWSAGRHVYAETGQDGQSGKPVTTAPAMQQGTMEHWRFINQYKNIYFEERLSQHPFLNEIDESATFYRYLSPLALAKDLASLEEKFYTKAGTNRKHRNEQFKKIYEGQVEKIRKFAFFSMNNLPQNLTYSDKYALSYIYSSALSKLTAISEEDNTFNVINTESYFAYLSEQLKSIRDLHTSEVTSQQSLKYKNGLDEKVNEAMKFIAETLTPAINKVEELLQVQSDQMTKEMEQFLQKAEQNVDTLREQKRKYESTFALRCLFSGLKIATTFLSFLGPQGAIAGNIIGTAFGVAEPFALGDDQTANGPLNSNVENFVSHSILQSNSKAWVDKKIQSAKIIHEEVSKVYSQHKKALAGIYPKLANVEQKIKNLEAARTSNNGANALMSEQELEVSTNELENAVKEKSKLRKQRISALNNVFQSANNTKQSGSQLNKRIGRKANLPSKMDHLTTAIIMVKSGVDFYQTMKQFSKKSNQLTEIVKDAEAKVKVIEQKRLQMSEAFLPMLKSITAHGRAEDFQGKSIVALTVKQWQVKSTLEEMKRNIKRFTEGMNVQEEIILCVDKLQEAIDVLVRLYEHIQTYEEKKQLADYIANVNSPSLANVVIDDPELEQAINQMRLSVHTNLFMGEYQKAMHAYRNCVFPYAKKYFEGQRQLSDITAILNSTQNLTHVADIYREKIEGFALQLKKYQATTTKGDETMLVTTFTSLANSSQPFFIWKNKDWPESIRQLLSGEKVELMANLESGPARNGMSGIKYKSINIAVRATNPANQTKVDEIMSHFFVTFTHNGISHYQVDGKKYRMYDNNVTYLHSFEKNGNGYVTQNVALIKQEGKGDFLLSPYTMWTVQIHNSIIDKGWIKA